MSSMPSVSNNGAGHRSKNMVQNLQTWRDYIRTKPKPLPLLPNPRFKPGDIVLLRVSRFAQAVSIADFRGYHNRRVTIEFIDREEEPRYGVRPVIGDYPMLFFHSDELWEC